MTPAGRSSARVLALAAGWLGLFAAFIYSAIPLQIVVHTRLGWMHGFVSDLGAEDQPFSLLFQAIDGVTGVSMVLLALALDRQGPGPRLRTIGCAALGLFGVCALGDSLMPLDCSTQLSTACKRAEHLGLVSWQHKGHLFSSIGTIVGVIASMVFISFASRRRPGWERIWHWWFPLAALTIVVAILTAVWALDGGPGGLAQRVMLILISAWIATISVLVLRDASRGELVDDDDRASAARPARTRAVSAR